MYLHKETGDKDTQRRGKYIKRLTGGNALSPEKSLLYRTNYSEASSPQEFKMVSKKRLNE